MNTLLKVGTQRAKITDGINKRINADVKRYSKGQLSADALDLTIAESAILADLFAMRSAERERFASASRIYKVTVESIQQGNIPADCLVWDSYQCSFGTGWDASVNVYGCNLTVKTCRKMRLGEHFATKVA